MIPISIPRATGELLFCIAQSPRTDLKFPMGNFSVTDRAGEKKKLNLGWTQEEIGKAVGLAQNSVHDILSDIPKSEEPIIEMLERNDVPTIAEKQARINFESSRTVQARSRSPDSSSMSFSNSDRTTRGGNEYGEEHEE